MFENQRATVRDLILELGRCPRPLEKCKHCQEIITELERAL